MSTAERRAAIDHLQQCRRGLVGIEVDWLREVFPAMFHSNFDRVWDQLRRRGLAEAEAKDIFQDTFFTAFLKLVELGHPENLTTYIYTIAKRAIMTHLRDHKLDPVLGLPSSGSEKPKSSGRRAERALLYEEMAERLTPEQRAVFEAVEIYGLTHEEVAGLLNIPEGTVKSRLRVARQRMYQLATEPLPANG